MECRHRIEDRCDLLLVVKCTKAIEEKCEQKEDMVDEVESG